MAVKECSATEKALQQINERVTCTICLGPYTQAKLLKCFHVYCMKCVQPLAHEGPEGQSVICPQCRQKTLLPPGGVLELQGAFYIEHLLEIQDTLQKVNSNEKTKCEKCKKRESVSFCRSCGFVCQLCKQMHQEWEDFSNHKVISLATLTEDVSAMVSPLKKIVYCSKHVKKEADLYCDTCDELICRDCIVRVHCNHRYDLVEESFDKHRAIIEGHLKVIEEQLTTMDNAHKGVHTQQTSLSKQQKDIETNICDDIDHLIQVLETRKKALIDEVRATFEPKLASLSKQGKEIELREEQLRICSGCVRESLRTCSQTEILSIKKPVVEEMTKLTGNLKANVMVPAEQVNIHYRCSDPSIAQACQQLGEIYRRFIRPKLCEASGPGIKAAVVEEVSNVCVQTVDGEGKPYEKAVEDLHIAGKLVSRNGHGHIKAQVKRKADKKYEVTYQPLYRGKHQLHIVINDQAILNSPFNVTVLPKLAAPTNIIKGLNWPWGIAIKDGRDIIVAEYSAHCVTTISCNGAKKSFGTRGSAPGQLNCPKGVAIDSSGNIIVADSCNHRIQKFSSTGRFIKAIGGRSGNGPPQFNSPDGIVVHPHTHKIYVADGYNGRIQILNSDLTLYSSFGRKGSNNGEFSQPLDIAIDSTGDLYIADSNNHRIQVFSPDGAYTRQFGRKGDGNGELKCPTSVAIDSNDVVHITEWGNNRVSIFTSNGEFIKSFGAKGTAPAEFKWPYGIAVNKNGNIYVCDSDNYRLQVF